MDDQNDKESPGEKNAAQTEEETDQVLGPSHNDENATFFHDPPLTHRQIDSLAYDSHINLNYDHGQAQQQESEELEEIPGTQMIVSEGAPLHGGSHAFNHNHGQQQPQQESLEMEEIQDAQMTVSDVVPLHGDSHAVSHCLQQEEGSMEVEEENEANEMTISNDTPLHGGIHAVSHNDGLPQQESFDGYMSTSPNGMARIQEANEITTSNDTLLHGGIHAVSHNNGLPQQESFDGFMSTSPYGMARVQEANGDIVGMTVPEVEGNNDNTIVLVISGLVHREL